MLGTVEHVEPGKIIARLDGRGGDSVSVPTDSYRAIDHGYATTIHKTGRRSIAPLCWRPAPWTGI